MTTARYDGLAEWYDRAFASDGPHSEFVGAVGVPRLHAVHYRSVGRPVDAPGISPTGLRTKVGATHLPLGLFIQSFVDAGLRIDRFEEPEPENRDFPYMVAIRARR